MLQTFKGRWLPRICASLPFGVWHRISGISLVVPHWHVVSDLELPHVSGLYRFRNIREFKADLEFLLRYYMPVTEQEVVCHLYDATPCLGGVFFSHSMMVFARSMTLLLLYCEPKVFRPFFS